ncbi:Protein disulfide isomerase-like 1-4 [Raphanus sativus]|uniref:Protein disulfide-isomerase n=1 Tax=Raphanus sativus TaxID=3726 RepID=A0A6J0LL21_RAPSA|nr:protein disulfide isomerase-like 1-4 [Raphanus sativus]KAJ4910971.1 Protein disulfide isomerase-like 1-4 [Raphanus sativus]
MASRVFLLLLSLTALLIFSAVSPSLAASSSDVDDDEEDLSFLEDPKEGAESPAKPLTDEFNGEEEDPEPYDDDEEEDGEDFSDLGNNPDSDPLPAPEVDEKDVVVIKERNFTDVIENNEYVMVEFYAPWCGYCQSLAPEYAAAATELKGNGVVLAKIDATEENELAHQYSVQGFPTILFFVDGEHKPYTGGRTKETIVTWVKKKIGPSVYNLTTLDDAEKVLTSGNKVVLGYLNSLVGVEHDQLAAASKAEDDVNFYQTVNPDVAKMFHIDPESKRPALVLVKREEEKISHFDGEFVKSALVSFVSANKLPLVTVFTPESAQEIFESAIKKQLLLFATKNESEKVLLEFAEAAKAFKGKLIFVYVDVDNEEYGQPVADYFGASNNSPKLVAFTGNEDPKKHYFYGEIKSDEIKTFGEEFLSDKLKPFYKSDPIPENNDGDVKIVVGDNFDEIVLDESKDVLLEVYAPWCGHCEALEPIYNKLAKHLRSIDSLVIAKMDGTTNEHPKAKAEGFPTILFFPAGNKTSEPITVDADRTVVAFYKFMRKHATIPFKLEKPESTKAAESTPKVETTETTTESTKSDSKDEL